MRILTCILICTFLCIQSNAQIFENFPGSGEVEVTLHPGSTVTIGSNQLVSFGVPFPRSTVNSVSEIIVTDLQGNELPSSITEITRWHSLTDDPDVFGVRAALVHVNQIFASLNPTNIKIVYGRNRTMELGSQGDVKNNWVSTELGVDDEYPQGEGLLEPPVYATLPASWLGKSVIRTRVIEQESVSPEFQWYEDAKINFGNTMIDEVRPSVNDRRINIENFSEWLYDRAYALWNNYFSTGDIKWLRAAHKASQYYAKEIHPEGYFIPKFTNDGVKDLKYSYGGCLLADLMLTGDNSLALKIEQVAAFSGQFSNTLTLTESSNFWTERNASYWIQAPMYAYEATGKTVYKTQTNERMNHIFFRAKNPINGWTPEGGVLHSYFIHEGGGPNTPIISPWMSALLSEAAWRYYMHSGSEEALEFLIGLADNVVNECMYQDTANTVAAYYLHSGQNTSSPEITADEEHRIDVLGLIARGIWARKKMNQAIPSATTDIVPQLQTSTIAMINNWIRPNQEFFPIYRLTPPRKYNWWFGTTSDLEWLLTNDPNSNPTGPDTEAPSVPINLAGSAQSDSVISIGWNASIDNIRVTGYNIYRDGSSTPIATVPGINFEDTGLTASTAYTYSVSAIDEAGNESNQSTTITIATNEPDIEAPSTPQNLVVTGQSQRTVSLSWGAATDNIRVTGYNIYRNQGSTPVSTITGTTFVDFDLSPATTYSYTVSAVDPSGNESTQSNSVSATTETAPTGPVFAPLNPATNGIVEVAPAPGTLEVPLDSNLIIKTVGAVISDAFVTTEGIQLFKEGDPIPIFQYVFSSPEPLAGQDEFTLDIPNLEINTNYYVVATRPGWAKIGAAPWSLGAIEQNAWTFSTGTGTLSVKTPTLKQKIGFYPNPVTDILNISLPKKLTGNITIVVYDKLSRVVMQKDIQIANPSTIIPLDISKKEMSSGVYFVNILSDQYITKGFKFTKK